MRLTVKRCLKVGTKYTFSIKAYNSLGESDYTEDIGKVETKSKTMFYYFMTTIRKIVFMLFI